MIAPKRKIVIWVSVGIAALLITALLLYFFVFSKNTRRVTELGDTTYKVSEFSNSELQFFNTDTFHIKIVRDYNGIQQLFFIGVGTYEKSDGGYKFTFTTAVGYRNIGGVDTIIDVTADMNAKPLNEMSGNRIVFVTHNNQVFYFA